MERKELGRTGLEVTCLGYGAMELKRIDEAEAGRLLNQVLDSGINFIDTSPDYGPSERYIGNAIAHRRDEYILATKCGCNVGLDGKGTEPKHIWTRERLLENIENSLRLLKTETIDVWQLHGTVPEWLVGGRQDEVITTMQELKEQGKVRAIGVSFRNGKIGEPLYPAGYGFMSIREFMNWGVFDVMQIICGAMTRKTEIVISHAAEKGVGIITRGALKRYYDNYDALFGEAALHELLEEGETRDGFLVRYAISHPDVSTVIAGSKSSEHIAENVEAAERGCLADAVYSEAKMRLESVRIASEKV